MRRNFGKSVLLACLLLVGCATPRRLERDNMGPAGVNFKNQKVEPEARTLFFQGERLFNARNFDQARQVYSTVKQKYPKGRAAMLSSYRLGTIYYYREEYQAASREFEAFLSRYPQSELSFDVNYNLAAAEYQQGNYEKAYTLLSKYRMDEIQSQGPRRAEVIFQLMAQSAGALGNHPAVIQAYASQMQLPLDERTRAILGENVDAHLNKISCRGELDRLLGEISEPSTRGKISARLSSLAASETVALVDSSPGAPSPEQMDAKGLPLNGGSAGEKKHIGVILPLSGKFAPYGRKALDGILLAAGTYSDSREEDFQIFVEDSASSPALAQQAVDNLFYQHNVIAVIGPMNWKESVAVAERAQQLGVLNLSLSAKEGLSERGAYLFQNALTPKIQVESLVANVTKERGFKRFAILAPSDSFGRDMANQFWDLTEQYGGRIVAYETYGTEEKDFQGHIRELTGLADPRFRKLEATKLTEFIQAQKTKTGKEPKSARLAPIVDFDAIFIPDGPKNVGQIAASLAYFDVSGVPLLGTTEWNTDQLFKRGGRYVEGAIFPAGLNLQTRNPKQRDFIRGYSDAFGAGPDLLSSQAFEAMLLVGAAVKRASNDRNDVVSELAKIKEFETPLGNVSFDNSRLARRRLPVLSLGANGVISDK